MQVTCRCGCELDIQSIDFDCVYDMTVYVEACQDCYDVATEEFSSWEDRATAAETDLEHTQNQLEGAQEELAEAQAKITKLNQQIEELGDLSGLH